MTESEFELEVEELFEELLFEFNVFACPDEFELMFISSSLAQLLNNINSEISEFK
tara:strand:- start:1994 stop:2158 length:165 start_codon:yes stop_codon:yes gene_type:complete